MGDWEETPGSCLLRAQSWQPFEECTCQWKSCLFYLFRRQRNRSLLSTGSLPSGDPGQKLDTWNPPYQYQGTQTEAMLCDLPGWAVTGSRKECRANSAGTPSPALTTGPRGSSCDVAEHMWHLPAMATPTYLPELDRNPPPIQPWGFDQV